MKVSARAVGLCRTAFFLICIEIAAVNAARAQALASGRTALDVLVQRAAEQVHQHYTRPLGSVGQRQRSRVFVLMRQAPPAPGTLLEAVRVQGASARVVAKLEVVQSETGITECREVEHAARTHAEPGDAVRIPLPSTRLLLAPCIALVDLAPEIAEVIGEKLRVAMLTSPTVQLANDADAERQAEASYLSGTVATFVKNLPDVTEVLYPVLLQTPGKLVLNLEYFSVDRGRATEIEVASVTLDEQMRAWLRAGRPRLPAPPGFRRLPVQTHAWRVMALAESPGGALLAVDDDSVHVLEFYFPGLQLRGSVALGAMQRPRRAAWCSVITSQDLQSASPTNLPADAVYVVSDERRPIALTWTRTQDWLPQVRSAPAELDAALERLWTNARGAAGRRQDARWWATPEQAASTLAPCFGDLDADGRTDVVWSGTDGLLRIKLASQRGVGSFAGFGDVKAVHPARAAAGRGTLWLTDPVWHGAPDRLHAAQLAGDDLQLVWSSEPFEGTITALGGVDLNHDGSADLVAAESTAQGTRLHAFVSFPERASAGAATQGDGRP